MSVDVTGTTERNAVGYVESAFGGLSIENDMVDDQFSASLPAILAGPVITVKHSGAERFISRVLVVFSRALRRRATAPHSMFRPALLDASKLGTMGRSHTAVLCRSPFPGCNSFGDHFMRLDFSGKRSGDAISRLIRQDAPDTSLVAYSSIRELAPNLWRLCWIVAPVLVFHAAGHRTIHSAWAFIILAAVITVALIFPWHIGPPVLVPSRSIPQRWDYAN